MMDRAPWAVTLPLACSRRGTLPDTAHPPRNAEAPISSFERQAPG